MSYDVIGDIHGQADKLVALLRHLGYRERAGVWRHTDRTAVFVGDLIDSGPRQVDTVNIVRRMVDDGRARCILGNHEFNAIAWHTRDPEASDRFLRRHERPGNRGQHEAFLAEVEGTPLHDELVGWFKTLPLWLDLGPVRVVHACWNDAYMDELRPWLGPEQTLTDELMVTSSRDGHPHFLAVEALCKGLEVELPAGAYFIDKYGKRRDRTRIRWWADDLGTYRAAALAPDDVIERIPELPMQADARVSRYKGPPVFVGHYWQTGVPEILAPNVACVDYSAGRKGALVGYRWDGEAVLDSNQFVVAQ